MVTTASVQTNGDVKNMVKRESAKRASDHLVAGIVGGTSSTVLLFPLDLIKVRFQVHDQSKRAYPSVISAFRTIQRQEGFLALYKGLSPAVFANALSWGGYFFLYENAKSRYVSKGIGVKEDGNLNTTYYLLSALESGIMMVFLTNPLWLIKTRLQLQVGKESGHYKNIAGAIKTIVKEEGIRGLYKGLVPALMLTSHGAIQFTVYEFMKNKFKHEDLNSLHYLGLGAISKFIASTATYPKQVIKARLQQRTDKYNGTLNCIVQTWKKEGIQGFYKGCVSNSLKVAPAAATTFMVYEWTKEFLSTI